MAGNAGHDERTEMPTLLRLREARRRGRVARSADLSTALVILAAAAMLGIFGRQVLGQLVDMTASLLGRFDAPLTDGAALGAWNASAGAIASVALIGLVLMVVAALAGFVQVGGVLAAEPVKFDFGRLSAAEGFRRIFSLRSLIRGLLAAAKIIGVMLVTFLTIRAALVVLLSLGGADAGRIATRVGTLAFDLAMRIGFILLPLAGLDYLFQRWQLRRDLKMTRREVAEEIRRLGVNDAAAAHKRNKSVEPVDAMRMKGESNEV